MSNPDFTRLSSGPSPSDEPATSPNPSRSPSASHAVLRASLRDCRHARSTLARCSTYARLSGKTALEIELEECDGWLQGIERQLTLILADMK